MATVLNLAISGQTFRKVKILFLFSQCMTDLQHSLRDGITKLQKLQAPVSSFGYQDMLFLAYARFMKVGKFEPYDFKGPESDPLNHLANGYHR